MRHLSAILLTIALVCSHGAFSGEASAQTAKDLVGTWTLVSVVTERDGRKFDTSGPNAKGLLVFDANGRYSIIFIAANLPKFVSGNRSSGTADENKAVVAGSLAHFGTYVVDEAENLHFSDRPRDISKLGGQEQQALVCHHWG